MKNKLATPIVTAALLCCTTAGATESWEPNTTAELVRCGPRPAYPPEALRSNTSGTVVMTLELDNTGHVTNFWTLKTAGRGAGPESLEVATMQWVRTCLYEAAQASSPRRVAFTQTWTASNEPGAQANPVSVRPVGGPPGIMLTPPTRVPGSCPEQAYPAEAKRTNSVGTTRVRVKVGPTGIADDAYVAVSSGHPALDEAALVNVRQCKFTAGLMNGQPSRSSTVVEYVWRLHD